MQEERIILRLTPELKKKIAEAGKKQGLNMSAYIRMVVIKSLESV